MIRTVHFLFLALVVAGVSAFEELPKEEAEARQKIRESLGVYNFSSVDYPATFAIIAGLSVILIVAVVFIVVGLLTMEPAKDSIIYRMTTQRMKKD